MNGLRAVYHLARADYIERARRSSFLIILGLTVVIGYFYLPANSATAQTLAFTLDFGGYRGVYNSSWVGTQEALFGTIWLSLVGFYLVKNTLERDMRTGVGQIIAATSLRKAHYTLGKALSNFAVLATMVAILAVAAGGMQLLRGEDAHIDLWALLSPFVFLMLPAMAVVAAGAILFESVSWLRGTVGNVAYALLFTTVLSITAEVNTGPTGDLLGLNFVLQQMEQTVKGAVPGYAGGFDMNIYFGVTSFHTFHWAGMQWTGELLWSRLLWVGVALAIALLAALFFTRFDPAYERPKHVAKFAAPALPEASQESGVSVLAHSQLTPLLAQNRGWRWASVLVSEVRLMVKGVPWWWLLGAAALSTLCLFLPFDVARLYLFPVAWLWSLPIWSALGNREARHHTEQLVFSTAHPLVRQLPMQWLAGVLMALLTASGMIAHFAIVSDWPGLLALGVGAVFIPALASAGGVWTGNSRLFEVVFVVLWYIGAINHVPVLDFMGVTGAAVALRIPLAYGCAAVALLFLACVGRQRQLQA
jgi:hypothetical protein